MTDDPKAGRKSPGRGGASSVHPAGPLLKEYPRPEGGLPQPGAGVAQVLFYRNGGHSIITARGSEHVGRPFMARPVTVCEVARGTHMTRVSLQVPAAGGTTFFEVEADIQWTVTDYLKVVDEQVTNVAVRLRAPLTERLRGVCAGYPITAATEADRAVKSACRNGQWDDLGYDLGLRAELYIRFTVDRKAIAQAEQVRDDDHRGTMAEREHAHDLAGEHHSGELLQLRMQKFRVMLEGGEWSQICFMLADNPAEARAFMELLRQEARQDRRELLDHTLDLVEKGVIQSAELESQVRELLGTGAYRVEGSFGRPPVRPAPPRRELPPGRQHDDGPDDRWDEHRDDRSDRSNRSNRRHDRDGSRNDDRNDDRKDDRNSDWNDGWNDSRWDERRSSWDDRSDRHDDNRRDGHRSDTNRSERHRNDRRDDRITRADGPGDTRHEGAAHRNDRRTEQRENRWSEPDDRRTDRTDRPGGQRPYTPSWLEADAAPPQRPAADTRLRRRPSEAFDDWEPAPARDAPGPRTGSPRTDDHGPDRDRDRGRRRDHAPDHAPDDDRPWSPNGGW
ncbi:hypothetical protein ABT263_20350 [Kitasatospora sp. NPDC001603]|uniref:hypothetical protein n=1 Tax=Kitasatospora sp. NPDC001603 TaxID=3154388 RepID=UPI0033202D12